MTVRPPSGADGPRALDGGVLFGYTEGREEAGALKIDVTLDPALEELLPEAFPPQPVRAERAITRASARAPSRFVVFIYAFPFC